VPPSEIMRYRRQLAKKARQEMKGFLDIVRRGHKRLIGGIWFGRARHVIPMVAKRLRGDDQGRVGLPCILLGTVAKHVIWQVDSDILMVRSGCTAIDIGGKTPRAT
jgi:hypothetical protein